MRALTPLILSVALWGMAACGQADISPSGGASAGCPTPRRSTQIVIGLGTPTPSPQPGASLDQMSVPICPGEGKFVEVPAVQMQPTSTQAVLRPENGLLTIDLSRPPYFGDIEAPKGTKIHIIDSGRKADYTYSYFIRLDPTYLSRDDGGIAGLAHEAAESYPADGWRLTTLQSGETELRLLFIANPPATCKLCDPLGGNSDFRLRITDQ